MQIEVLGVTVENKGKYRVADVQYKSNGKSDAKKIMSFTFKDVFTTLSQAKQGDLFDVKAQKNDKGYWDWTEVSPAGKNIGGNQEVSSPRTGGKSTYETPEERARKQVYIVRQSSITAALELLKANGINPITEADVIRTAQVFEQFVFATEPVVTEAEVT